MPGWGSNSRTCAAELRVSSPNEKLGQTAHGAVLHTAATIDRTATGRDCELASTDSQSARWRRMAAVPEERFESYLRDAKARGCRICTADVLKLEK